VISGTTLCTAGLFLWQLYSSNVLKQAARSPPLHRLLVFLAVCILNALVITTARAIGLKSDDNGLAIFTIVVVCSSGVVESLAWFLHPHFRPGRASDRPYFSKEIVPSQVLMEPTSSLGKHLLGPPGVDNTLELEFDSAFRDYSMERSIPERSLSERTPNDGF